MKYILLCLLLFGCGIETDVSIVDPKFKVGDCITFHPNPSEFEELNKVDPKYGIMYIKKVGKFSYLVDFRLDYNDSLKSLKSLDFSSQYHYIKIDCKGINEQ